ncbi:MAG: glycosyltransferase family 39 protein [Bryobacteraceae bacterium]|jgi:4-amino-4-deoxy-L-arabinose transferase-like glycosyltransferase
MDGNPDLSGTWTLTGDRSRSRFLLLALACAILFLGAIRSGDLAGYDDALYATEAKNVLRSGDWLNPSIRGEAALEHPPLFVWTQALCMSVFGISDIAAKAPSALSAIGTVLLVYWLARRLLRDQLAALVAMFVMLATPYFIKYASHAMTDVPTTLLFVCAMCAWSLVDRDPRWCLAAGAFTAMALMTRGLIGFALPAIFAIDLMVTRSFPPKRYLMAALLIAILPLTSWYAYAWLHHSEFTADHSGWLEREVYGPFTPSWRRYTGPIETAFMLGKSYWPWLPAMVAGLVLVIRRHRRELYSLLSWAAVVFLLCSIARSRVLRYLLPAYPAFAILSASAIAKLTPRRFLERAMSWIPPASVLAAVGLVVLLRPIWHASEILPIARAASHPPGQTVGFYDASPPRWDEANQLEWYGDCVPRMIRTPGDLDRALRTLPVHTFVVDKPTYENVLRQLPHDVVAESGHLVCVRLR